MEETRQAMDDAEASRTAERLDGPVQVRNSDLEPYVGLRYLSKLFKLMAIVIALLLVAEVIAGLATHGSAALPNLLPAVSRLLVLAGLLWGFGDIAILLVDVGHDVRATRILLGRQSAHHLLQHHPGLGSSGAPEESRRGPR
jgi:hypothetical protein